MRKTIILVSILIVFVTLSITKSIYQTRREKIKNIEEKISEEQQKNTVVDRIAKVENSMKKYDRYLASTTKSHWLLEKVTNIADQTGVDLISISPGTPKEEDRYVLLPVMVNIRCNYHQFGNFISKLESSEKIIRLDKVNLGVIREFGADDIAAAQSSPLAKIRLVVSVLYLK